ncbi:MAG: hypothetical protein OHK0039_35920 [Bacteroidia bacterium]
MAFFMFANKKHSVVLLPVLALVLCFAGCRKYEDGPTMSLRSKQERVVNNWKAVAVYRNDLDETQQYEAYNMIFNKSGRLIWQIQPVGQALLETTADWELANVKEAIKLTYDNPADRLLYLDIMRLTEEEMWIHFLSIDGNYYDIRLEDM